MGEREALGRALGSVPSGIFLCSCGVGADSVPFIASWVQQVAMDPPAVTVAIEQSRSGLDALAAHGGAFTLSVLPQGGDALMKPFFRAAAAGEDPFGGLPTGTAPGGGLYLQDALSWLECREIHRTTVGGHVLVVGDVLAGDMLRDGEPRIHVRKSGFGS